MYQKVREYVQKKHMLDKKDRVVAGVSGGADSVCLFFMLLELRKEIGFELCAVHVNHQIRGEAADADQAYVEKMCREQKVDCVVCREDVPAYAKKYKLTEEEAGRKVRREAFLNQMKEWKGTKIALAHHQNDNVETLIFHLCRGTGLAGLSGIVPVEGAWIRPLLCLDRKEIESYLEEREIFYCTDETNQDVRYTRNRIRQEVIPYLERYINSGSVSHMARTLEELADVRSYMEREVESYSKQCLSEEPEGVMIWRKEYEKVPEELRKYVLHGALCKAAGEKKDIGSVHVQALEELFGLQTGRRINLPYRVEACKNYDGILLVKDKEIRKEPEGNFEMRVFDREHGAETFPQNPYTKWFDYDIIKNTVKIRHRQPGDYITINASGGTQKLKQYFINEKIPQKLREDIWVVADGNHVLWVVGYRQNQAYQISDRTKHILEITFYGGKKNGRDSKSYDS